MRLNIQIPKMKTVKNKLSDLYKINIPKEVKNNKYKFLNFIKVHIFNFLVYLENKTQNNYLSNAFFNHLKENNQIEEHIDYTDVVSYENLDILDEDNRNLIEQIIKTGYDLNFFIQGLYNKSIDTVIVSRKDMEEIKKSLAKDYPYEYIASNMEVARYVTDRQSENGRRMEKFEIPDFKVMYNPWIKNGLVFVCSKDFIDDY